MTRDYWRSELLKNAAALLEDAAKHLDTSYPHSIRSPNPHTLPVVKMLIKTALDCIKEAQPEKEKP
jgi:hypothetical protein